MQFKDREHRSNRFASLTAIAVVLVFIVVAGFITTADTVQQTAWALVPPVIAIALALITKEVYSSLFFGILTGALLFSGYHFEGTINHIFVDGIISVLSDSYNVGILCFLVILGAMVQLMNRSGGSAAFGDWASKHIRTRAGAQLATIALGCLIFIDDYFNCLTVGSVMRPVTDKHKISRAKLAYLIDSTAAPICIIAPISSWAAAVSGFVEGENGMSLFLQTIPYNFYALLTIAMMILMVVLKVDFGPMHQHEVNAIEHHDLYTTPERPFENAADEARREGGHLIDMLVPIFSLVICCVIGMIYTGGFFSGTSFIDSFAGSDASVGLVFGSFCALVITLAFYLIRNVLLQRVHGLPAGGLQADGSGHPDPHPRMVSEGHDRQPRREGVRRWCRTGFSKELPAVPSGHHLHDRHRIKLRDRYLMGNLWYPDSDRRRLLPGHRPQHDDPFHVGLHGRCGLR